MVAVVVCWTWLVTDEGEHEFSEVIFRVLILTKERGRKKRKL